MHGSCVQLNNVSHTCERKKNCEPITKYQVGHDVWNMSNINRRVRGYVWSGCCYACVCVCVFWATPLCVCTILMRLSHRKKEGKERRREEKCKFGIIFLIIIFNLIFQQLGYQALVDQTIVGFSTPPPPQETLQPEEEVGESLRHCSSLLPPSCLPHCWQWEEEEEEGEGEKKETKLFPHSQPPSNLSSRSIPQEWEREREMRYFVSAKGTPPPKKKTQKKTHTCPQHMNI